VQLSTEHTASAKYVNYKEGGNAKEASQTVRTRRREEGMLATIDAHLAAFLFTVVTSTSPMLRAHGVLATSDEAR